MVKEREKLEGQEIALEWAEERTKLTGKHRALLLALEFVDAAAKTPIRKIVTAMPGEQRSLLAERLKTAAAFLSDLSERLTAK
jgi:hypothetical protein